MNDFLQLLSYPKLLLIAIDRGQLMGAFSQNWGTGAECIKWLSRGDGIKFLGFTVPIPLWIPTYITNGLFVNYR